MTAAHRIIDVTAPDTLARFVDMEGVPLLAPERAATEAPDLHVILVHEDCIAARCSLWWNGVPTLPGHRLGLVGHYAAEDAAAGRALLSAAGDRLRERRCTLALGPMDGATWRPYRFVTERGTHPPFFMEPHHPPAYPHHFEQSGFSPLAHYRSAHISTLEDAAPTPPVGESVTRPLDADDFERELHRLYELVTASFSGNFLYTPIHRRAFVDQFRALRSMLDPSLVRIAEMDGHAVAFCFALPDHEQAKRGETIDTVVVKTLGVHPSMRGRGLGSHLVSEAHAAAHDAGYRHAIHALMHEDNVSNRISNGCAETIRRYTLFARAL